MPNARSSCTPSASDILSQLLEIIENNPEAGKRAFLFFQEELCRALQDPAKYRSSVEPQKFLHRVA